MAKPALFIVAPDPDFLKVAGRHLNSEFGDRFQVHTVDSGASALEALNQLKQNHEPVALFLVEQQMPGLQSFVDKDSLIGKVGAVFTSGGGYGNAGGGCELTMLAMLNNFAELGMVMVPLPKNTPGYQVGGLQWGPNGRSIGENMEQTGVTEEKLEAAKHHGANVSRVASVLKGHNLFAKPNPGEYQ